MESTSSTSSPLNATHDCVVPFLFEQLDIRGAWVNLHQAWAGLTHDRRYPLRIAQLLGEMSAVSALIAANLKQPGRMTFQLKGEGPVNLLVLDCDEQLRLRGMARWQESVTLPEDTPGLLGQGNLLLSLDAVGMRQPYQSLVPLEGDSLASIFEHYLTHSEQQPTRLALAADATVAAGLFLQTLPGAAGKDADGWNRIQHLFATLRQDELLHLPAASLLHRLFPEDDLRLYPPRPLSHHCPKDWEKIHAMLRALGRSECEALLREHGEIHVRDDICNHDYRLDAAALNAVFKAANLH